MCIKILKITDYKNKGINFFLNNQLRKKLSNRKFIKKFYFPCLYFKAVSIMLNQSPSNYFNLIII